MRWQKLGAVSDQSGHLIPEGRAGGHVGQWLHLHASARIRRRRSADRRGCRPDAIFQRHGCTRLSGLHHVLDSVLQSTGYEVIRLCKHKRAWMAGDRKLKIAINPGCRGKRQAR